MTAAIAEIQGTRMLLSTQIQDTYQQLSEQIYNNQEIKADLEARAAGEKLRKDREYIIEKLGNPSYKDDHQTALGQRHAHSGDWILAHSVLRKWMDQKEPSHSTVYVHGIPGAGKSTSKSNTGATCLRLTRDG